MFNRALILSGVAIGAFFMLFIVRCSLLTEEDRKAYEDLMQLSQLEEKKTSFTFQQQKKNIQKDVYVQEPHGCLHIRIQGQEAELVALKDDIVEKIRGVHCFMQEELFEQDGLPMQIVRWIEADHAEYHYQDGRFIAYQVNMARYLLPGHELREIGTDANLLMIGTADEVAFSLKDGSLRFKAQNVHLKGDMP